MPYSYMLLILLTIYAMSKLILVVSGVMDDKVSIYLYTLSVAYTTQCAQLSITACDDESGRPATEAEQRLA